MLSQPTGEMLQSLEKDSSCPEGSSSKLAYIQGVYRQRIGVLHPGWGIAQQAVLPATTDCGVGMDIVPPKHARSFPAHFSPSHFSKGKRLWMLLLEAITST